MNKAIRLRALLDILPPVFSNALIPHRRVRARRQMVERRCSPAEHSLSPRCRWLRWSRCCPLRLGQLWLSVHVGWIVLIQLRISPGW